MLPRSSLTALVFFLGLLAITVAAVRPPLLRMVALYLVEKQFGVTIAVSSAVPHGLLEGIHLHQLQVRSAETLKNQAPLFTAEKLRVESGILGTFLQPSRPDLVSCDSMQLRLDFDSQGKLLTKLPKVTAAGGMGPRINIRDWQLVLAQRDRPDLVLGGLLCDLTPAGNGYIFRANLEDVRYGIWSVTGTMESQPPRLQLSLSSAKAFMNPKLLRDLPFVPSSVWSQVTLEGFGQVRLDLDIQPQATRHHLWLKASELDVNVPIAGIQAKKVSGYAEVAGRLIDLRHVKGECWGGQLVVPQSRLDFDKPFPVMTFHIGGDDLRLADLLRQQWAQGRPGLAKLALFAKGTAKGFLEMAITLTKPLPMVEVSGAGEAGLRGGIQIHWRVRTEGGRIHFEPALGPK